MNRLLLPRITILLLFAVLVGRLYQLQLVDTEASRYRYDIRVRTTRYLPIRPLRGEVFASDGTTLLAESVPIFNVAIRPADLNQQALPGSPRRAALFAQLSQIIDVTSTLTISPAVALEQDAALRSDLNQGLGPAALASLRQASLDLPLQLTLSPAQRVAADGLRTRHAALVQITDLPPAPGQAAQAPISATLTISPASGLDSDPTLRADLLDLLGPQALDGVGAPRTLTWATLDVPPDLSMVALKLSQAYSTTLILNNPLAEKVDQSDIPGYETLTIKEDIPQPVALVLRENAASLPGVVVEQDYRRRYPLSGQIPSLSHLLGYIGRIDECRLVSRNTARSWISGLLDSIGHAAQCGVITKQINPYQLGMPRYLNDDRIGKDGVEASYEDDLRGQLGVESIVVNALGEPVRAPETIQQAHDGNNLVLTIDVAFQRQVEQILRNWIEDGERRRLSSPDTYKRESYKPISSGVAIVAEVQTGRILAMVSWPTYDNNIWVDPARAAELRAILAPPPDRAAETQRLAVLTNRAITGQYPPGSTLKQFDAAVALQNSVITPDTIIRDPGRLLLEDQYVPGLIYTFVNSSLRDNGRITVSDALKVSSNIFFMSVAGGNKDRVVNLRPEEQNIEKGLGITRLAEGLSWFGFGTPTGVKLVGEETGRVPTPAWKEQALREQWTTGDTYNTAIGQGNLLVTPLQLVMAGAAIANSGTLYRPQIVQAITDRSGQVITQIAPEIVRQVPVDPSYYSFIRDGMHRSVTEGINRAARLECSGLDIAGKTGTAEFGPEYVVPATTGGGTRMTRQSHSWFVGFAPFDNPQIEVLVLSEGTGDLSDGSATIAVPAVTQIMQAYFKITPPNPLPRTCQQNMPPLPARVDSLPDPSQAPPRDDGRGR